MSEADLLRAIAEEEAALAAGRDRFSAIERLRSLHERAARLLLGCAEGPLVAAVEFTAGAAPLAEAKRALAHFAEAERWQGIIGTWATGSGEGLASMHEIRELQLAQAWLLGALAGTEPDAKAKALRLASEVEGDPNGIVAYLEASARRLRAMLARV